MITENLDSEKNRYQNTQLIKYIYIPSGQRISSFIDSYGVRLRGLLFPQNWTACNISFYSSAGQEVDLTFIPYLKTDFDGTSLSIPTLPSQDLPIVPAFFDATKYFQIFCDANQIQTVKIIALFE